VTRSDAAQIRNEGDARWLREGCECERRGLPVEAECIYDSPCPSTDWLTDLRTKAERHIVYPRNRDECLALIARVDELERAIERSQREARCGSGLYVD
jgi:hypothetical protein